MIPVSLRSSFHSPAPLPRQFFADKGVQPL
jgi:hypothetical protein